jgi:hypothetical protein
VGVGVVPPGQDHAVLWNGTPESAVDLHPAGNFDMSIANDTDGANQVGFAREAGMLNPHAALWSGSAASFVDLHPTGYLFSEAMSVSTNEQVGSVAAPPGLFHAGLWRGSAESFVDLNPNVNPNWGSQALDTNGVQQVGFAALPVNELPQLHATVWTGTAPSIFDLHNLLPLRFAGIGAESRAMGSTSSATSSAGR